MPTTKFKKEMSQGQPIISGHHVFQSHKLNNYCADVCSDSKAFFSPLLSDKVFSGMLISITTLHMKYDMSLILNALQISPKLAIC